MNLQRNPGLMDRLAAEYALGSLRGGARRRLEALARELPELRSAVLVWQARLAAVTELQASSPAPPVVWTRIENALRVERERAAMAGARSAAPARQAAGGRWPWRGLALASVALALLGVYVGFDERRRHDQQIAALQRQLQGRPLPAYVAVLNDERAAAAFLVTFDPQRQQLTLTPVIGYVAAADRSLQLWALAPGGAPRSLGVIGDGSAASLQAAETQLQGVPALAISLEPRGGAPAGSGPTGPVLFKGALLRTAT